MRFPSFWTLDNNEFNGKSGRNSSVAEKTPRRRNSPANSISMCVVANTPFEPQSSQAQSSPPHRPSLPK